MFDKFKAKRKIKKQAKIDRFQNKQDEITERKSYKQKGKTSKKRGRVAKRVKASLGRTAKKLEKKGYGDIDINTENEINEIRPLITPMSDYLDEQGIDYDPNDEIEVASRYAMANPDINDPLDDETYENAYINQPDHYQGDENFEHFNWKETALAGVKSAFGGVKNSIQKQIAELKDKKASGSQLSANEQKLLDAEKTVKSGVKNAIKGGIADKLGDIMPIVVIFLVIMIVVKR